MAVTIFGSGGGNQQSPGVNFSEIDLTTTVPSVSTSVAAFAGVFEWGPVELPTLIDSENTLANKFGKPSNYNPETWFSAANFLAYSNALYVTRAANSATISAFANTGAANASSHTIKHLDDYNSKVSSFDANVAFIAKYPGALGNSLKVSVCDSANQFSSNIDLFNVGSNTSFGGANTNFTINVGSNTATITISNTAALASDTPLPQANTIKSLINVGDLIEVGNTSIGKQLLKVTSFGNILVQNTAGANSGLASFTVSFDQIYKLASDYTSNTFSRKWEYYNQVEGAPLQSSYVSNFGNTAANDELHVVVSDKNGAFTGSPGSILEVWSYLSRASDAKSSEGGSLYYKNVLRDSSNFVWAASSRSGAPTANSSNIASSTEVTPLNIGFNSGANGPDESSIAFGDIARAYDFYKNAEEIDISLLITGKSRGGTSGEQLGNYLIDNIAEVRKDCVVFVSPAYSSVVGVNSGAVAGNVVDFRNNVRSTSYGVLDSGYKYQYDKYNDVYRYIPLNGDIAGLTARTDSTNDPWFSPAGTSRGTIKNIIKLPFNPSKADRDLLYKNGVNPVVTFPGQGTILYGDKTLLKRSSAFDRIGVRRLFITLEKSISEAAKNFLFEFNDAFSRANFINLVEPYLRDVQGRRGLYDFKVVCDETNNTPQVVDTNRFIGDIYLKPNRSINFVQLNFINTPTGVSFEEISGVN